MSRHHDQIIVGVGNARRIVDKDLRGCETVKARRAGKGSGSIVLVSISIPWQQVFSPSTGEIV
jgi:hypothetical protein